jgi:hypothetical protein
MKAKWFYKFETGFKFSESMFLQLNWLKSDIKKITWKMKVSIWSLIVPFPLVSLKASVTRFTLPAPNLIIP